MIEISHKQARLWLRMDLDHQLPDRQWDALQVHLETCAECRVYRAELAHIEKDLRRAVHNGWDLLPGPGEGIPQAVLAGRQSRELWRRRSSSLGMVVVAVLLFLGIGGPRYLSQLFGAPPPAEASPQSASALLSTPLPAATPEPTLLPTAGPGEFPAVVAYAARRDGAPNGDSEIYLLNSGAEPVDLTNNPAEDPDPVWSPDGEWLAFLSNRPETPGEKGKFELYVTNVLGTRLVQLTREPGITWQGPPSWSEDGKWIALTGIREQQGGESWVYLVPLDGSAPRPLAGTRGGFSPEFAPNSHRLAFRVNHDAAAGNGAAANAAAANGAAGVEVMNLDNTEHISAQWPLNDQAAQPQPGSGLDWSADGASLVYIAGSSLSPGSPLTAKDPAHPETSFVPPTVGSQVVAVRDLNDAVSLFFDYQHSLQIASSPWPNAFSAVSWSPGGTVVYLEDLSDARANNQAGPRPVGCATLQVRGVALRGADDMIASIGALCVDGGLDRASWSPDGRWLVVVGRVPGETQRGIYAVRMPGRLINYRRDLPGISADAAVGTIVRLTGDPHNLSLPSVRPQRRLGRPLAIVPRPAWAAEARLPQSDLSRRPGGPNGQLVYTVQNNTVSVVVSANPDGTGGKVLTASTAENRCTRWSPDGQSVALVVRNAPEVGSGTGGGSDLTGGSQSSSVTSGGGGEPVIGFMPAHLPVPAQPQGREEVYVLELAGGSLRQVSNVDHLPENGPPPVTAVYGCPVWSPESTPGGPLLAVLIGTGRSHYLALLSVQGGWSRYLQIGQPVADVAPVWSSDGRSLFLAEYPSPGKLSSLLAISLPDDPRSRLKVNVLAQWPDLSGLNGLAAAPNSPFVALVAPATEHDGLALVELRQVSAAHPPTSSANPGKPSSPGQTAGGSPAVNSGGGVEGTQLGPITVTGSSGSLGVEQRVAGRCRAAGR